MSSSFAFLRRLLALCSLALPAVVHAATFDISAMNNTGGDVFDVHVLITGTGGTIHDLVAINPLVQALDAGPGNEVNGSWTPGLANGGTWEAQFDVNFTDLGVAAAYWTDKDHKKIADIQTSDVHLTAVPEPSSALLLAGGLLMLGAGRALKGPLRRMSR